MSFSRKSAKYRSVLGILYGVQRERDGTLTAFVGGNAGKRMLRLWCSSHVLLERSTFTTTAPLPEALSRSVRTATNVVHPTPPNGLECWHSFLSSLDVTAESLFSDIRKEIGMEVGQQ